MAIDQTGSSAFLNSSIATSAYSGVDKGALPFVPYVYIYVVILLWCYGLWARAVYLC